MERQRQEFINKEKQMFDMEFAVVWVLFTPDTRNTNLHTHIVVVSDFNDNLIG
jgi:hypothetical protein